MATPVRSTIAAMLAALLCAGCTSPKPTDGNPASANVAVPTGHQALLPIRVVVQEHSSGLRDSTRRLITDGDALATFWRQAYQGRGEIPPVPSIDFSREVLVVATLGTRATGGYSIHVDSARVRGNSLEVYVRRVAPAKTCGTTAALTAPVVAAVIPRTEAAIRFVEGAELTDCG